MNRKDKLCIISTFIWGLVAHSYMFLSSNFSHDSLNALYAGEAETKWKITVGRFLVIPLRALFGKLCLPWVYGIISLLFISFAVCALVRIFELEKPVYIVLSAGIMTVNITVTAMTATYLYELPFDMLSMLCAVLSAYAFFKFEKVIYKYVVSIALAFISLGLYQSYICVSVVIFVLVGIKKLYQSEGKSFTDIKKTFGFLIKAACTVLASVVMYYVVNMVVCRIANITPKGNFDITNLTLEEIFKNTVHSYLKVARRVILPISEIPDVLILAACLGLLLVGIIVIVYKMIKNKCGLLKLIVTAVLALMLPLFMNLFGIVNYYSHDLMLYAIFVIYPFLFCVIEENEQIIKKAGIVAVCTCMALVIWNNILIANTCYLRKDIENKAVLSVMTRVVDDLEDREDYTIGETPLVFIGHGPFKWEMEGFDNITEISGMYFRTPITYSIAWYFDVYKAYFAYVLKYPMVSVDEDTYEECEDYYEENYIPSFPSNGYIVNHDGILIVNMGIR